MKGSATPKLSLHLLTKCPGVLQGAGQGEAEADCRQSLSTVCRAPQQDSLPMFSFQSSLGTRFVFIWGLKNSKAKLVTKSLQKPPISLHQTIPNYILTYPALNHKPWIVCALIFYDNGWGY